MQASKTYQNIKNGCNKLNQVIDAHQKGFQIGGIFAAVAIFTTLCTINITHSALWYDEAFSAYIIRYDFSHIWHYTATDVHPPLYYWLLKIWASIFTPTGAGAEIVLRSFSVFCGVITVISSFFLSNMFQTLNAQVSQ